MTAETAQQKLQRIRAECAIARVEHQIAFSVLSPRPQPFGEAPSTQSLAEQKARLRLLTLHDQVSQLEADSWVYDSDAFSD